MQAEIFVQSELTGQGQTAYSRSRSSFMADGVNNEANQGAAPGPSARLEGVNTGRFADSDVTNPDTRSTLGLIAELEGLSPELRQAAADRLAGRPAIERMAEERGLTEEAGERRTAEIEEGLPARGASRAEAHAGEPPGPGEPVPPAPLETPGRDGGGTATATATPVSEDMATTILRAIDPDVITDPRLSRVVKQAGDLIEDHEVYSSQIERLLLKARDMQLDGADEAQADIIIEILRDADAQASRDERFFSDSRDIELISAHPLLKVHLNDVTNFLNKLRIDGKVNEDELHAVTGKIGRTNMDLPTKPDGTPDYDAMTDEFNKRLSDFDLAKAILLGNISEAVGKVEGKKRNAEFGEKVTSLVNAMKIAGSETSSIAEADAAYEAIEKIIKKADPEDRQDYSLVIEEAINQIESTTMIKIDPATGDPVLDPDGKPVKIEYHGQYDHVIEFVLEYGLERILSQADKAPQEDYPQFSLYVTDNIDRIVHMARVYDETRERDYGEWKTKNPDLFRHGTRKNPDMFGYLVNLRSKRRTMHELFRGMKDPNTYLQYVTQLLRKTGFRFVEKDIAGVADVQIIYEQVLSSALAQKKQGWLTDLDFERADEVVAEAFRKSAQSRPEDYFKRMIRADGRTEDRQLRKWEVERAAKMGRSINAASQRRIVYAILGDLPENPALLYKSLESEYIARRLAPLKLFADRFFDQPLAKSLMRLIRQEVRRDPNTDELSDTKFGYVLRDKHGKPLFDKEGKPLTSGLYGQSQAAFDIMDLMIVDPKSNGWRGWLLFLEQSDYRTLSMGPGGEKFTIGEYLDKMKRQNPPAKDKNSHPDYGDFNGAVARVIKDQRLFLGVLMRYRNLDDTNLEAIWENAARFIPSRVAAFFPEETENLIAAIGHGISWLDRTDAAGNVIPGTGLRDRLWLAERLRVKNDAEALRVGGIGTVREISDFFEAAGITDPHEIAAVKALQKFGRDPDGNPIVFMPGAKDLVKIKQPFTAFLDDAPKTDWENMSDEDFNRILVSDQNDFAEGYGHLVGLIANPVMKPEEFSKVFIETIHKIQGPPGIEAAQKTIEPFVTAGLRQRRANALSKAFGSFLRDTRIAGSEIEMHNLQAQIADNEAIQKQILITLAQADVISDDPGGEKDVKGRTQYVRMLDQNDADRKAQFKGWLRVFLQLLGPALTAQFFKQLDMKGLGLE